MILFQSFHVNNQWTTYKWKSIIHFVNMYCSINSKTYFHSHIALDFRELLSYQWV